MTKIILQAYYQRMGSVSWYHYSD